MPTLTDVIDTFDSMHVEIARDLDGATVHICVTDPNAGYDDEVFVLYEKAGQLYEVHDSHCSCHGFDNWHPEATTLATLQSRAEAGAPEPPRAA